MGGCDVGVGGGVGVAAAGGKKLKNGGLANTGGTKVIAAALKIEISPSLAGENRAFMTSVINLTERLKTVKQLS